MVPGPYCAVFVSVIVSNYKEIKPCIFKKHSVLLLSPIYVVRLGCFFVTKGSNFVLGHTFMNLKKPTCLYSESQE